MADPQPTDRIDPNAYLDDAITRIRQQGGVGTYGEGRIGQAVREFQGLESAMRNGQLSQADYVRIGTGLRSQVQPILNQVMMGGSAAASAGRAVGAYDLPQNYFRNLDIYQTAQDTLGRDITPNEVAMFTPYFGSGTPKELEAGRATLAQVAEQEKNSPEALNKKYQEGATQYGGQVGNVFQDLLKRGASQPELDHFGKMLASGQLDEYTLRQFVSQLPEYRQREDEAAAATRATEDTAAREQLASELGKYDQEAFSKAKENVISRYAQAGIQNSSALDFALTNLMGDIQKERSAYLADVARRDYESNRGFRREDYLGNKDLLRQDYMTNLDRMFGSQDYARSRSDQLSDMMRGRSYNVADYTTQRNDLLNLLNEQRNQGQRRGGIGGLVGGLVGAGVGSMAGPQGAMAGYNIGQGTGGIYDYLNY